MNRPVSEHETSFLLLVSRATSTEHAGYKGLELLALLVCHPVVQWSHECAQHIRAATWMVRVRLTSKISQQLHRAELVIRAMFTAQQ